MLRLVLHGDCQGLWMLGYAEDPRLAHLRAQLKKAWPNESDMLILSSVDSRRLLIFTAL